MKLESPPAELLPANHLQPGAAYEQLERILSSDLFRHSKRYPRFLRYVVEQTLKGDNADLKERVLGVTVFGRNPEYDTNADPVVRNTASEVRKRIEQYYSEQGHENELRITIPIGSYVPAFKEAADQALPFLPPITNLSDGAPVARRWYRTPVAMAVFGLVFAGLGAASFATMWRGRPAIDRFWDPVLQNSTQVPLLIGPLMGISPASQKEPLVVNQFDPGVYLLVTDAHARLGSFLQSRGKKFDFELAADTTAAKLRKSPFILLGAFNNAWTMRATKNLRYYLRFDREHMVRQILDRDDPVRRDWRVPMAGGITEDYALVVRAAEPITGQWMLVIAGMGEKGGAAATEFLTNPRYLETLASTWPRDWHHRNVEFVIQSKLVDGDWATPRVVASYFW